MLAVTAINFSRVSPCDQWLAKEPEDTSYEMWLAWSKLLFTAIKHNSKHLKKANLCMSDNKGTNLLILK